jgi:NAD(P)-dependent dehydrogenase (short-subunit alcohol dehydrogenase family)
MQAANSWFRVRAMGESWCVVTGASAGIGRETARGMAERGFSVVIVGRDAGRCAEAASYVQAFARAGAQVRSELCDFSSLEAVRALGRELSDSLEGLSVLINNAGLWHPDRRLSKDGLEDTFAVNHLASFLLTQLLLPRLRAAGSARVVNVSSRLHEKQRGFDFDDYTRERRYRGLHVYAQTKLANVMFSTELAARLAGTGVTSNALHPGDVVSDIIREMPLLALGGRLAARFFDSPTTAARTSLHLASEPELAAVSGGYFKKCRPARPSPATEDAVARARLWELSEQLVGS